jgi:hypothetical protein
MISLQNLGWCQYLFGALRAPRTAMRGRNEYRIHATSRIAGPSLDAGGATPYDGAREDNQPRALPLISR